MEKQFVASISGREGHIKVYEDLPILQMRNEDFALPNARSIDKFVRMG